MPIRIEKIDILKKYFQGVVNRTNHHAPAVDEVIYTLLGVIILKMDAATFIEVYGTDENASGNILWVIIAGTRYAFRYEHSDGTIEIRENSYKGKLKLKIDNATTSSDVLNAFI